MSKIIKYIVVLVFGASIGFFLVGLAKEVQPNYRWVQIFNESGCKLTTASVLFPDRSVVVTSEQAIKSVYPYQSEADLNIPVLFSEKQSYHLALEFDDCAKRITENQKFSTGTYVRIWVGKDEFRFAYR